MKNEFQVEIFGSLYSFSSDEGEVEYKKIVARYLDEKMKEVSVHSSGNISTAKVAILSALNIADELFKLKKETDLKEELVNKKTAFLAGLIGKEIEE